jgi:hypothetical protein
MNRGVVTPCPKGTYRAGNAPPTSQLQCVRCNRGWTTVGVESFAETHCNQTVAGFESNVGNQAGGPATACGQGYFSTERPGGTPCSTCPDGYTTRDIGVDTDNLPIGYTSASACNAPPGYYATGAGIEKCPNGTYASGWARRLGPQSCTSCGTNIFTEHRSEDEFEYGFVSAQPTDCCKSLCLLELAMLYICCKTAEIIRGNSSACRCLLNILLRAAILHWLFPTVIWCLLPLVGC